MEPKSKKTEELEPGEVICSECNGLGYYVQENIPDKNTYFKSINIECSKCFGNGKLDWIENVVGKRLPKLYEVKFSQAMFDKEYKCDFSNILMKDIAKKMSDSIDADILKILTNEAEVKNESTQYYVKPWRTNMS